MVVGDGESWLTELSTDTLRELFSLGAEALDDGALDDGALDDGEGAGDA
jgi:hypothetical protein